MNGFNFTERVRRVLQVAREQASALRHGYVGTEHILLGLSEGGGVAVAALTNLGVDLDAVRRKVLDVVQPGAADGGATTADSAGFLGTIADAIGFRPDRNLPYTSRAKKTLELSISEARALHHSYVGTEHLLLGLLREEKGIAAQVLTSMGITTDGVRFEVIRLLGAPEEEPSAHATSAQARRSLADAEAAITLVVEHPDGRIEAKKFRRAGDAVSFLKALEY